MKKIVLLLILISLFLTSTVFANQRLDANRLQKREAAIEMGNTVIKNHQTIKSMTKDIRVSVEVNRQQIKYLLDNPTELSIDQMLELKEYLLILKSYQVMISESLGTITAYGDEIKSARGSKDYDLLVTLYEEVSSLQQQRITDLTAFKQTLADMYSVLLKD